MIIFTFLTSNCIAASLDEIKYDKLESFVVSQSGEQVSQSLEIDLNSDGENDKLIGVTCGNAGCNYYVFIKTGGNSYIHKGSIFLNAMGFEILKTSHRGINDILAYIRSNVNEGALVRYEHDGRTYIVKTQLMNL
jgi:hypothetical protein